MTEVVTNSAAFLQPFLQPNKAQAFGVSNPDSPQFALQLAEANREHASLAAQDVQPASDDRASTQHNATPNSDPQFAAPRPKPADVAPRDLPAAPVGPSKARVDLPPIQLAQTPPSAPVQQTSAPTPQPAPTASAPAAPTPAPTETSTATTSASTPDDTTKDASSGPLGPAEALNSATVASISENIIGVAFAPTQVSQTAPDDQSAQQHQKNFIFAQRRVFSEAAQATGKFAAEETKHVVEQTTSRFAVEAGQPAATTVASGKFATQEANQKLADKAPVDQKAGVTSSGEVHLYDKVAPSDSQNNFAQDNSGNQSSRESLYQRAQAIANALGSKADNPEVQKLFAELEAYKASIKAQGGDPNAIHAPPSVVVTA